MFVTNSLFKLIRLMKQPRPVTALGNNFIIRQLAQATTPTGGPRYLAAFVEDLKKRGLKENGDINSQNIFNLFKLEQKLIINEGQLKREYMRLQRSIHPDRFVNSDSESQDRVLRISSLVNEAYETLRHPYKRAKYLLSLSMGKSQEELDRSLDSLKMDDQFLARMMELREQAELSKSHDSLVRISAEIEDELTDLMVKMSASFKESDTKTLLEQLGKLKFLGNLHVKLADRTESFSSF